MNECPFPVEEKIRSEEIQAIVNDLGIPIITTPDLFAADLNLHYAGYQHYKRLRPSRQTDGDQYENIYKKSKLLVSQLKNLVNAEDAFFHERLNVLLSLSHKQKSQQVKKDGKEFKQLPKSTIEIISTLEHLIMASEKPLGVADGCNFVCTPLVWFMAVAIPRTYEKHTGLKHSRSFNTEYNSSGKPHAFAMRALKYFDDFQTKTDRAVDTAIVNYRQALKENAEKNLPEYKWPYEWTS